MANFTIITEAREEILQCVSCLQYQIKFLEHPNLKLKALFDSKSELNVMHLDIAQKLGL